MLYYAAPRKVHEKYIPSAAKVGVEYLNWKGIFFFEGHQLRILRTHLVHYFSNERDEMLSTEATLKESVLPGIKYGETRALCPIADVFIFLR